MSNLSKTQIFALIGFIIILVSIPLAFSLLKNTQIFKSKATELESKSTATSTSSTKPKEVPGSSPLTELQKLLEASQAASKPEPTPTTPVNIAFGPTLNIKIDIEGRPAGKYGAKVFIGIAAGTLTTKPAYVLTFTVDFPEDGIFRGLSLAGLNPGSTYTAYIKGPGQIDAASTFAMSPTESSLNNNQSITLITGELNEDNTINTADYTIAKNLYGINSSSRIWNERADFNRDGVINNLDLGYITKNFGKTGASGTWYSPVPQASSSGSLQNGIGGPESTKSGGFWLWVPPVNK